MRYLIDNSSLLPATAQFQGQEDFSKVLEGVASFEDGGYSTDPDYIDCYQNYVVAYQLELLDPTVKDCRTGNLVEFPTRKGKDIFAPKSGDTVLLLGTGEVLKSYLVK